MEKLELVKSFDELRTGVVIVIKNCQLCTGMCRGMCIEDSDGDFEVVPSCDGNKSFIDSGSVERGNIFRVVDEEPKQAECTKKLEFTR